MWAIDRLMLMTRYMARPWAPPKVLPARPDTSKVWRICWSPPSGTGTEMPSMPVSERPLLRYSTMPSMANRQGTSMRATPMKR